MIAQLTDSASDSAFAPEWVWTVLKAFFGTGLGAIVFLLLIIFCVGWLFLPFVLLDSLRRLRKVVAAADSQARTDSLQIIFLLSKIAAAPIAASKAISAPPLELSAHEDGATYYLVSNGQTVGPYSEMHVRKLIRAGGIDSETRALRSGEQEWSTVGLLISAP